MSPQDPSQLRISDDDRHRVGELLREAAGEGRLDLTELDERLERTYAAKTYADLVPITVDLPARQGQSLPSVGVPAERQAFVPSTGGAHYESSHAIMSSQARRGEWDVGPTYKAFSLMGEVILDLREARFTTQEVVITANSFMGAVTVVVNARTRVYVDGVGFMGDFKESRPRVAAELGPDSPIVRVKGLALMAAVKVIRRPMPGEEPRRFGILGL